MAREFDVFYDASDSWAENRFFSGVLNGAQTITAFPKAYTIQAWDQTSDPPQSYQSLNVGAVLYLKDASTTNGVNVGAYMEVTTNYTKGGTSIELRPLLSAGDVIDPTTMTSVVGHEFATASVVGSNSD